MPEPDVYGSRKGVSRADELDFHWMRALFSLDIIPTTVRKLVVVQLVGSIRLTGSAGKDCTPNGRKACGILALLALSPGRRRARRWIQDKLWSDRAPEQASASLRQSLAEIRRALGEEKHCLISSGPFVELAEHNVTFDVDTDLNYCAPGNVTAGVELLHGLDIRDPEFETWLREQRQRFATQVRQNANTTAADIDAEELTSLAPPARTPRREQTKNRLIVVPIETVDNPVGRFFADGLLDTIARTISELAPVDVIDMRNGAGDDGEALLAGDQPTLKIQGETVQVNDLMYSRIVLKRPDDNQLIWSKTFPTTQAPITDSNDEETLRNVNEALTFAVDCYLNTSRDEPTPIAATLCYQGILHLFRLGRENCEVADRLFARAYEIEQRGVYLAWRAYLRTFLLAERMSDCQETTAEEALDFMHRALAAEPFNSFVSSLCAHVQALVLRSYVASYELAERSIQLNPANPLGWMTIGIAKCYLGKANEGFLDTMKARQIAGTAPYRFQIDGTCCVAGVMAGRFNDAIWMAEAGHGLMPMFAPPIRYLAALYMKNEQDDASWRMVEKMQQLEPDFSYESLADPSYPAAGLRHADIIKHLPGRQV